jgi:metal-responsive CopG/Arc/MetJ family transcriptional regulator
MPTISFFIQDDMLAELDHAATVLDRSRSQAVREGIRLWLDEAHARRDWQARVETAQERVARELVEANSEVDRCEKEIHAMQAAGEEASWKLLKRKERARGRVLDLGHALEMMGRADEASDAKGTP